MDFDLSEEQLALRDSLGRLLRDRYSFEHRRSAVAAGLDEDTWQRLSEMGLPALLVPQECDGLGGNAADLIAVCGELGRALVLQPFVSSSVIASRALALASDRACAGQYLGPMSSGALRVAWAHDEAQGASLDAIETQAIQADGNWLLSGRKVNVLYGQHCGAIIVSARCPPGAGLGLFILDAGSQGIHTRSYTLIDDTPAAQLSFKDSPARLLHHDAGELIAHVLLWAAYAACAEAVGVMEAAMKFTIDYLAQRKQFGQVLSGYQSLRHRVAEMSVDIEVCRALSLGAAIALDGLDSEGGTLAAEASARVSQAKLVIGRLAQSVCESALQLHGGIGMTQEYAVGTCLRRAICLGRLFGDDRSHARMLAEGAPA